MKPANVVSDELSEASQTSVLPLTLLFCKALQCTVLLRASRLHTVKALEEEQYETRAQNTDVGRGTMPPLLSFALHCTFVDSNYIQLQHYSLYCVLIVPLYFNVICCNAVRCTHDAICVCLVVLSKYESLQCDLVQMNVQLSGVQLS